MFGKTEMKQDNISSLSVFREYVFAECVYFFDTGNVKKSSFVPVNPRYDVQYKLVNNFFSLK